MTVIAWDGTTLAADKRVTCACGKTTATKKISRAPGGELLATVGHGPTALELRAWWLAGADPDCFPNAARADNADLLVIDRAGVRSYCAGPHPMTIEGPHAVAGSGGDVARGVLHMGGTAVEAVQAACLYRGDCGDGVDVLTL